MAEVTVTVGLKAVEDGVKLISAKVGLKSNDWEKTLHASDENSITNYEKEGAYGLIESIGRYCTGVEKVSESYVYTLEMPTNWDSTAEKVAQLIEQYFINFVCSRWFGLVLPEQAETYKSYAERYESIVFKELIMRGKPLRN